MKQPKLILLSGFPASGKTTLGRLYLIDHPLALFIEGDELIVNLGQWLSHEPEATRILFELVKSLITTQLSLGYDVVYPFLLRDASQIAEIEAIAQQYDSRIYEFYLKTTRESAIGRLLERGSWGEPGLDPISEQEIPRINKMYDTMLSELAKRPDAIALDVERQNPDTTYEELLSHLVS